MADLVRRVKAARARRRANEQFDRDLARRKVEAFEAIAAVVNPKFKPVIRAQPNVEGLLKILKDEGLLEMNDG